MCFYVNRKDKEMKTASQDIECYKVMFSVDDETFAALNFSDFHYKKNEIKNINKPLNKIPYPNKNPEVIVRQRLNGQESRFFAYATIDVGFHSLTNKEALIGTLEYAKQLLENLYKHLNKDNYDVVGVACIIPSGSHYYENQIVGEYVSDSLIVKGVYTVETNQPE